MPLPPAARPSREASSPASRWNPTARLVTDRQLEILSNVAQGKTNREIGEALGISERTVRNHMRAIMKRLASSDRTHAVVLAIGNGWISIPIEPDGRASTLGAPTTKSTAGN